MGPGIPADWPNRECSRPVHGPLHRWHMQECGAGDPVPLLHGAGGSVHSYRALLPLLAEDNHALAPDLPGHGFTRLVAQRRSGTVEMAEDLAVLSKALDLRPTAIIGHSAGAAIALQMARSMPEMKIIGINPALSHFVGLAGVLFPVTAGMLAAVPFVARLFSGTSSRPDRNRALIDGTGSRIDAEGVDLYRRLVAREAHVAGTLAMMAQCSLDNLPDALPAIRSRTLSITGAADQTVLPRVAPKAAGRMPDAEVIALGARGHLIHEEIPAEIARICRDFLLHEKSRG